MGHGNSDRLYITHEELSGVLGVHTAAGGQRQKASERGLERLPFDCCALSLQPWTNAVCSPEGTVFELTNIIPFLKKHGVNPATGAKLDNKDLVRLSFHKNAIGKFHDPISFKVFNEHSHIVALRASGNVFLHDTVHQLNIKAKFMKDLLDDTPFTKADLITIQDPHNFEGKSSGDLHHLKAHSAWSLPDTKEDATLNACRNVERLLKRSRNDESIEKTTERHQRPDMAAGIRMKPGDPSRPTSAGVVSRGEQPRKATASSTGSFTTSGFGVQNQEIPRRVGRENASAEIVEEPTISAQERKRMRREADRTTWLGTNLGAKEPLTSSSSSRKHLPTQVDATDGASVGRFLAQAKRGTATVRSPSPSVEKVSKTGRVAGADGFGDFSSW